MSLKVLELDTIELTYPTNSLKLSVVPKIHIRLPSDNLASLGAVDFVQALTSGKVWVTRGRACRISVQVSFEGKPLDASIRLRTLEALGYHLRDAQLWTQLSLSPSLEILQSIDEASSTSDIIISLNPSTALSTTDVHPRGWLLDDVDIQPPECVPCAKFGRLEICLDFRTLYKAKSINNFEAGHSDAGSPDPMLLDCFLAPKVDHDLEELEQVVDELSQNLSSNISRLFSAEGTNEANSTSWHVGQFHHHRLSSACYRPIRRDAPFPPQLKVADPNPRLYLADENATVLSNGFPRIHFLPNEAEGGETVSGSKSHGSLPEPPGPLNYDDDMLLLQADEALFDEEVMLFSQSTSETPSLTSQTSTISANSAKPSFDLGNRFVGQSLSSTDPTNHPILQISTINALASTAMHCIVTGSPSRSLGTGIGVRTKTSSARLPIVVPSIFLPGFKQLVSHNARFLPTISNALCSSMVRNAQGPGLRGKLVELSSATVLEYDAIEHQESGSMERLAAVVQSRVWTMMQRQLFDLHAWRRLKSTKDKNRGPRPEDQVEDADLLGEKAEQFNDILAEASCKGTQADIGDHDEDLFEGLLFGVHSNGDNERLLHYFEVEEQRLMEMETDEMLFGGEEDEKLLLGDDYSDADGMLLDS